MIFSTIHPTFPTTMAPTNIPRQQWTIHPLSVYTSIVIAAIINAAITTTHTITTSIISAATITYQWRQPYSSSSVPCISPACTVSSSLSATQYVSKEACKGSPRWDALPSSSINCTKLVPAKQIIDRNPKLICGRNVSTLALKWTREPFKTMWCSALLLVTTNSLLFRCMN